MNINEMQSLLRRSYAEGTLSQTILPIKEKALSGDAGSMKEMAAICRMAKREEEAFRWTLKAADAGDPEAAMEAAIFFASGEKRDLRKAAGYYRMAAEQGNQSAIQTLARLYQKGGENFPADEEQAFLWNRRGAEAGIEICMCECGLNYEKGIGTEEDPERALFWYEKCSGNPRARLAAGKMQEEGRGTERNVEKALVCYSQADYLTRRDLRKEVPEKLELSEKNVEELFISCLSPDWPEYDWYHDFDQTEDCLCLELMRPEDGFAQPLAPVCFSREALKKNRTAIRYLLHQLAIPFSGPDAGKTDLEKWKRSRKGACWTDSFGPVLRLCQLGIAIGVFSVLRKKEDRILICRSCVTEHERMKNYRL